MVGARHNGGMENPFEPGEIEDPPKVPCTLWVAPETKDKLKTVLAIAGSKKKKEMIHDRIRRAIDGAVDELHRLAQAIGKGG